MHKGYRYNYKVIVSAALFLSFQIIMCDKVLLKLSVNKTDRKFKTSSNSLNKILSNRMANF